MMLPHVFRKTEFFMKSGIYLKEGWGKAVRLTDDPGGSHSSDLRPSGLLELLLLCLYTPACDSIDAGFSADESPRISIDLKPSACISPINRIIGDLSLVTVDSTGGQIDCNRKVQWWIVPKK